MSLTIQVLLGVLFASMVMGDTTNAAMPMLHVPGSPLKLPGLNEYVPGWNNITDGVYIIKSVYKPDTYDCLTVEDNTLALTVSSCIGDFGNDAQRFNVVTTNDGQFVQLQSYKHRNEGKSCITGDPKPDQTGVRLDQCYHTNILYGAAPSYWTLPFGGMDNAMNHYTRFMVGARSLNFLSYHPDHGVYSFGGELNVTDSTYQSYWAVVPAYNW
ncbi:hypothetical protein BJ684DRAFT_17529 [Piptocephalis cylindrospora]|uniref:Uncharacterized protein n=1 Tax=Piptocephalis cylindrospora TaxID=1907219 RepID=A0A4P9XZM5_9FUNG|nr:hypothetical protein BJ684DRAFT_17529 [Piptocephalis cylindrospora]|eukprot:RKP11933.1 hypothetical protein BJ684DRAFT_17529 [Piptocephalis cylindrospora]